MTRDSSAIYAIGLDLGRPISFTHPMNLILNIGLNTNTGGSLLPSDALAMARELGFFVVSSAVHQSNSELTLVVMAEVPAGYEVERSERLARDCRQDCIAIYTAQAVGQLVGPKASAWGPFNPDFFLMLDGRTLRRTFDSRAA